MSAQEKKMFKMNLIKQQKEMRAKADLLGGDPFLSLGFGLIAYRTTLYSIFIALCIISVISYPTLHNYQ